jgi:hypothetical protein
MPDGDPMDIDDLPPWIKIDDFRFDDADRLIPSTMQSYLRKRFADQQGPSPRDIQARRLRAENLRRSDAAPAANRLSASYVSL